ncbi:MAG: hypothetical protein [Circular genetic element sp.]|nr:MAG: hypothetical protein [Circular genetic element sp.]
MPHSYAITISPKHAVSNQECKDLTDYLIKTADGFILWTEEGTQVKKHIHGQIFYHSKYTTPASLKKYLVKNIYGKWSTEEKQHGCRIIRAYSDWYEDYSKVSKKDDQEIKVLKDLRPEKIVEFIKRPTTQRRDPEGAILKQLRTDFMKTQPSKPSIETVCHYLSDYFHQRDFVGCPTRPERQRALASSLYFMLNKNETHKMFLPKIKNETIWLQEKFEQINI